VCYLKTQQNISCATLNKFFIKNDNFLLCLFFILFFNFKSCEKIMRQLTKFMTVVLLLAGLVSCSSSGQQTISDLGAKADGTTVNTKIIQKAIDQASANGGGTVIIPSGIFKTGTLYMKDNVELHLMMGAVLKGSSNHEDYPINEPQTYRSHTERYSKRALIFAEDVSNIAITGFGTIDGNSYAENFFEGDTLNNQPLGLKFISCNKITVKDVSMRNARLWMQHYLNCEDVNIDNIKVFNHGHHTNDGLVIDGCREVRVSNAKIDSHDDGIVLKSTGYAICEGITISNCVVRSQCHGIKMGTETVGGFKRIAISNMVIMSSKEKHRKMDIEVPVITAIALQITDGGTMEDISINNIVAKNVFAPIFIKLGNRARKHKPEANDPPVGSIKNIIISNLQATSAGPFSSSITGFPGHYVENVTLQNIRIHHIGGGTKDEIMQKVPENETSYPEIKMFGNKWKTGPRLPSYGLFIRHVKNITLDNVQIELMNDDARVPIYTENVHGLVEK